MRQAPPRGERQRQVLEWIGPSESEQYVVATGHIGQRMEGVEVRAGGDQCRGQPELRELRTVPGRDREEVKLGPVSVEDLVATLGMVWVIAGLDVLHEVDRQPSQDARAPDRRRSLPPGRDLDRLLGRECLDQGFVVGKAPNGTAQLEPIRLIAQRPQLCIVTTFGEAVQMFEHISLAAGQGRVLRHVYDPQLAVIGQDLAIVEERTPVTPEDPLRPTLSLTNGGAPGEGLVVVEAGRRLIEHLVTCLPGAQAVVDVLVAHPVLLVEQTHIDRARPV